MALNHQLDNLNELKSLSYKIHYTYVENGITKLKPVDIGNQNVIDTQIVWDITTNHVEGTAFIIDEVNILYNMFVHHSLSFRIEAIDKYGVPFNYSFNIVNVISEAKDLGKYVVRVSFIDPVYAYFNDLYISRGYTNVRFDEVLSDILGPEDPNMFKRVFSKTKTTYENFVIPGHRSFANFLANREAIDGCSFIQNRNGLCLLNAEDLNDGRKVIDYTSASFEAPIVFTDLHSNNELSPYQIRSLKRNQFNTLEYGTYLPAILEHTFDYSNKTINRKTSVNIKGHNINSFKNNLAEANDTLLATLAGGSEFKLSEVNNPEQNNRYYSFKLLHNSLYELTVDGTFNLDIMSIVGLMLHVKRKHNNEFDTASSGHYYITKIVDKIQGNHFNQIVTLGRAGYTQGANIASKKV